MNNFGSVVLQRSIVLNALRIALVVGTILNMINQGTVIMNGQDISWGQVFMNFAVPYCVASYSAAKNEIDRNKKNGQ